VLFPRKNREAHPPIIVIIKGFFCGPFGTPGLYKNCLPPVLEGGDVFGEVPAKETETVCGEIGVPDRVFWAWAIFKPPYKSKARVVLGS